jgi:putative ABC transport system permease protein
LVGWLGIRLLERSLVDQITFLASIPLDPVVLGFTVAATLVTVLAFGIGPALQGARVALAPALRDGSRGTEGRAHRRLNGGFVVAQLALSVVLLAGSGLLIRSFEKLMAVDPGFHAKQVLVGRISVPWNVYREMAQVRRLALGFLERVRSVPGVLAAGLTSTAPFGSGNNQQELRVEGQEPAGGEPTPVTSVRRVTVGYFEAIGTPLLQGRYFEEADRDSSQLVVIIDEAMARRYWPGGNPIGARINTDGRDSPTWRTVVGVVASIHHRDLSKPPDYYVYQPLTQGHSWVLDLVVRSAAPVAPTEQAIRQALVATDPGIPFYDVHTLESAVDRSLAPRRLTNRLLLGFTMSALLLAALGIYGVMTRMVLARTREFGVRLALGASPTAVRGLVVRQSAVLVALGLGIGLVGAAGLSQLLGSLLFEVEPIDPLTFAITPALLVAVAATATFLPARRATAVDPLEAIRSE